MGVWQTLITTLGSLATMVLAWYLARLTRKLDSVDKKVDGLASAREAKIEAQRTELTGKDKLLDSKDAVIAQQDMTIDLARKAPAE